MKKNTVQPNTEKTKPKTERKQAKEKTGPEKKNGTPTGRGKITVPPEKEYKNYICINGEKTQLTAELLLKITGMPEAGQKQGTDRPDEAERHGTAEHLIRLLQKNRAESQYSIDDTIETGNMKFRIIGFDHDRDIRNHTIPTATLMCLDKIPKRRWHDGPCKKGWEGSEIRKWLNETHIHALPKALHGHIILTCKRTFTDNDFVFTFDRLFLPSESELYGTGIHSLYEGHKYPSFTDSFDRRMPNTKGKSTNTYWTRTQVPGPGDTSKIVCVLNNGNLYGNNDAYSYPDSISGSLNDTGSAEADRTDIYVPVCFTIGGPPVY